jgi:hypothetical protein
MLANFKCTSCSSSNHRKLNAEIALHFPGLQGLTKPIVWAFPEVVICLNCGFAAFALTEAPLKELRQPYTDDDIPSTGNSGGMWL